MSAPPTAPPAQPGGSAVPTYTGPPPSYQESQGINEKPQVSEIDLTLPLNEGGGQPPGAAPAGYSGYGTMNQPQMPKYHPGMPSQHMPITLPPPPQVVVVGGCPACRVGILEDDFTCLGVACALIFFPIGVLCCLAMRQRRCPNCGAIFG